MDNLYIVAGLGNPGLKYRYTRHNAGFMAVDILAEKLEIKMTMAKHKGIYGAGHYLDNRIIIVKPQTYMNNSGESIRDFLNWYGVSPERLIVVYDDLDLPAGKIRVRRKGSAGSHKGMKSIIYHINTDDFPRIRIGIGASPEGMETVDYVLSKFREEEYETMKESITEAADAAMMILRAGIDKTMATHNS